MAESTLSITYTTIQAMLRELLGDATKDVDQAINGGYRMSLHPPPIEPRSDSHRWSFLHPEADFIIWPSVAVGAALVTGVYSGVTLHTTLTATVASFYPSMVGRTFVMTAVGSGPIVEYTSSTVVVVEGNLTGAGKTFSIAAEGRYALPDDFHELDGDIAYPAGVTDRKVELVEPCVVQRHHELWTYTGDPTKVAVLPRKKTTGFDPAAATRWDAYFWPTPSTLRTMILPYSILPEKLSGTNLYPVGGMTFGTLVEAACIAYALQYYKNERGAAWQFWMEQLARMVAQDRGANRPRNLGYCGDASDLSAEALVETRRNVTASVHI